MLKTITYYNNNLFNSLETNHLVLKRFANFAQKCFFLRQDDIISISDTYSINIY